MFNRPRIIPTLLLHDQDLVKTVKFKNPHYLGDPINAVKIFNIKRVDEMSILDISATKNKKEPDFELLKDIASQAFMPLSYGGGLTNMEQIKKVFSIGYEKVVLNTSFVENQELVKSAVVYAGSQSVVVSIDAIKTKNEYRAVIRHGTKIIAHSPVELAKIAEELGAGEIMINSVDHDGMMNGYDIELIKAVTSAVNIPVIACGGASGVSDLRVAIHEGGAHAAAGGSMFVYYGKLKAVLITFPSERELTDEGIYTV